MMWMLPEELEKVDIHDEETDVICDNCGRHMVIKYGPHGRFKHDVDFRECRNTKTSMKRLVYRVICGKEVVLKKTIKGRMVLTDVSWLQCEDNPNGFLMSWQKLSDKKLYVQIG